MEREPEEGGPVASVKGRTAENSAGDGLRGPDWGRAVAKVKEDDEVEDIERGCESTSGGDSLSGMMDARIFAWAILAAPVWVSRRG